nr:MAG TPA: hypothetical protein [Caudoviricetes sp.]
MKKSQPSRICKRKHSPQLVRKWSAGFRHFRLFLPVSIRF